MTAIFGTAGELAEFDAESFCPKVLFKTERAQVVLAGLEAGQQIPLHAPGVDLTCTVLQGEGEVWVDDAPRHVAPGHFAVIPAGATRGVRAHDTRMVLLLVVSPPPSSADHQVERRPWPA